MHVRQFGLPHITEHEIRQGIARELPIEAQVPAGRRNVDVFIVHGGHDVGAHLELVVTSQDRHRVQELHLRRELILGHEVRRAQSHVARDVDAHDAAAHRRIGRHALEADLGDAVLAERVLLAIGDAACIRHAQFIDHGRAQHPGPSADRGMRLEEIAAPGRGRCPVDNAAEEPGHEPGAVGVDVADKQAVTGAGLHIDASQIALAVVLDVRLAHEVVGAGGVRQGHQVHHGPCDRIEAAGGNGVVRERLAGQRITNRRGEDAVAFIRRSHAPGAQHALADAGGFEITEEEGAVPDEGTARVEANLVLVVRRLGQVRPLREEGPLIEPLVTVVVVCGAADVIGA